MADDSRLIVLEKSTAFRLPTPIQGEHIAGITCRLRKLNNLRGGTQTAQALKVELARRGLESPPGYIHQICALLSISKPELLRQHTCVLSRKLIVSDSKALLGAEPVLTSINIDYLYNDMPDLRMCPSCMQADMSKHGTTTWRAHHQISGTARCKKCSVVLLSAPLVDPLKYLPHEAMEISPCLRAMATTPATNTQTRYEALAHHVFDNYRPIGYQAINGTIRRRMVEKGYAVSGSGLASTLTSLIKAIGPIPDVLPSDIESFLTRYRSDRTGIAVLALAAVLSESLGEAVEMLNVEPDTRSRKQINSSSRYKYLLAQEKEFLSVGASYAAYAKARGISPSDVENTFRRNGQPDFAEGASEQCRAAFLLYMKGYPLEDACRLEGARVDELNDLLRRAAVPAWRIAVALEKQARVRRPRWHMC